jgi:ADP-heptose:LPS heptosyltransferase
MDLSRSGTIVNLGEAFDDFSDTAAAIANLDLVISIDTSVAHLAGAMGRPVWLLLPFAADWRWLKDRSDSPWYPTMRIFRQHRLGQWDTAFYQVAHEISKFSLQMK